MHHRRRECLGVFGCLYQHADRVRAKISGPKRKRGAVFGPPFQAIVVNAAAASAGRCQRRAPQERCDLSTNLCVPGGVVPPSVSILLSYACSDRIASPSSDSFQDSHADPTPVTIMVQDRSIVPESKPRVTENQRQVVGSVPLGCLGPFSSLPSRASLSVGAYTSLG
jgi:hypothetical protein